MIVALCICVILNNEIKGRYGFLNVLKCIQQVAALKTGVKDKLRFRINKLSLLSFKLSLHTVILTVLWRKCSRIMIRVVVSKSLERKDVA